MQFLNRMLLNKRQVWRASRSQEHGHRPSFAGTSCCYWEQVYNSKNTEQHDRIKRLLEPNVQMLISDKSCLAPWCSCIFCVGPYSFYNRRVPIFSSVVNSFELRTMNRVLLDQVEQLISYAVAEHPGHVRRLQPGLGMALLLEPSLRSKHFLHDKQLQCLRVEDDAEPRAHLQFNQIELHIVKNLRKWI